MNCSHDAKITGHRIIQRTKGNGASLPKFEVYEDATCTKCGQQGYRSINIVRAHDAREAGEITRIPAADLPAAAPGRKSKAVMVAPAPTDWPFHTSSRYPKEVT